MNLLLQLVVNLIFTVFFCSDEFAVGNGNEGFWYFNPDFRGCQLTGVVEAGEPEARVFIFALCPDLGGFVGAVLIGDNEVKTALRFFYTISDRNLNFFPRFGGVNQPNMQLFTVIVKGLGCSLYLYGLDIQVNGIQG